MGIPRTTLSMFTVKRLRYKDYHRAPNQTKYRRVRIGNDNETWWIDLYREPRTETKSHYWHITSYYYHAPVGHFFSGNYNSIKFPNLKAVVKWLFKELL
jgi:hypothetical protein